MLSKFQPSGLFLWFVRNCIGITEAMVFAGMGGMFYGLHGFDPRIAWTVCGGVLFLLGLINMRKNG